MSVLVGDALTRLRELPDNHFHCCVTSPPYWGLRDYGVEGQIGLEASPDVYLWKMVEIFREVRRVLRDDGTLWINMGDTTFKKKLLCIPHRLAWVLQREDDWVLRQDIVWHKPNPMPSSTRDRCTPAHEYVFLLAKSERYFFDMEAVKEPIADARRAGKIERTFSTSDPTSTKRRDVGRSVLRTDTRQPRSVWTITPKPFKEAHFATFPPELPEKCIKAGTSEKGCCGKCGAPIVRVVERQRKATRPGSDTKTDGVANEVMGNRDPQRHVTGTQTVDWQPSCKCDAEIVPCRVLDPFGGAGTTGLVAQRMGRDWTLIELNPDYAAMAEARIAKG